MTSIIGMKRFLERSARLLLSLAVIFATAAAFAPRISAAGYAAPKLSEYAVFADRIAISVDNLSSYPSAAKFEIAVSGRYLKTVSRSGAKTINIYDNAVRYLKPSTRYTVTVTPVVGGSEGASSSIKVKTAAETYYKLAKGTAVYKLTGGKMKKKTTVSALSYAKGTLVTSSGKAIAGLSPKKYKGEYVRLNDGSWKGLYVKAADVCRARSVTAQRYIVSEYGRSMDGGSYVWGAAQYRRTDCSGLTMQCYALIGRSISHSVSYQSTLGKSVSLSKMERGDLIILNYRSHVAMYIGGGKMVHAMNSAKGIRVEPISKLRYYHVDTVRRIIY